MLQIRLLGFTDPDAQNLIDEVQAEYTVRYGGPDETPLDPSVFDPPSGAFFVGYLDGVPLAMGGWRFRPDVVAFGRTRSAEIKRMYVAPSGRRKSLAREILAHLESTAHDAGADLMILETGLKQPEAIALYSGSGYQPVEPFGHYAWSPSARYYGKPLP